MGGAPPPPLGAAPQGGKNPEKFGPKRAGFWPVLALRGSRPEGGGGGSSPLPDPACGGRPTGPPGPAAGGSSPCHPPRRAIERLGTGSARSLEASDAASGRSSPVIWRNQGPGDPPPFQGLTGTSVWAVLMDRSFKRQRTTSLRRRRHTMLRMASSAGRDAGVARPVARANRNAAMGSIGRLGPIGDAPCGRSMHRWLAPRWGKDRNSTQNRAQTGAQPGTPPGPPPGPLRGPRAPGGKNPGFSAPGAPRARGPPGGPPGPPGDPSGAPRLGAYIYVFCTSGGVPRGVPQGGPPGGSPPGGQKVHIFLGI